jgi:hypothetical protein
VLANEVVGFKIGLYSNNNFFKQALHLMGKYIVNKSGKGAAEV